MSLSFYLTCTKCGVQSSEVTLGKCPECKKGGCSECGRKMGHHKLCTLLVPNNKLVRDFAHYCRGQGATLEEAQEEVREQYQRGEQFAEMLSIAW